MRATLGGSILHARHGVCPVHLPARLQEQGGYAVREGQDAAWPAGPSAVQHGLLFPDPVEQKELEPARWARCGCRGFAAIAAVDAGNNAVGALLPCVLGGACRGAGRGLWGLVRSKPGEHMWQRNRVRKRAGRRHAAGASSMHDYWGCTRWWWPLPGVEAVCLGRADAQSWLHFWHGRREMSERLERALAELDELCSRDPVSGGAGLHGL